MRMIAPRTGAPEITVAENQLEYRPIVVAVYNEKPTRQLLTRWTFTPEEREAIARGEDVYFALLTFGQPMQPISASVGPAGWLVEPLPENES